MENEENKENNSDPSAVNPTAGEPIILERDPAEGVVFDKQPTPTTPTETAPPTSPTETPIGSPSLQEETKTIEINKDDIIDQNTIPTPTTNNEPNIAGERKIKTINLNSGEIEGVENLIASLKKEGSKEGKVIDITEEGIVESTEEALGDREIPLKQVGQMLEEKKESLGETTKLKEKPKEKKLATKTVRTFKEDIAKTLKESKASVAGMVLSEKRKQRKQKQPETKMSPKSKILLSIMAVIALALITTAGIYVFLFQDRPNTPKEIVELKIPTLIFPNYQKEVNLTRLKRNNINVSIEKQKTDVSIPLGQIIQLYLTTKDSEEQYMIEKTDGFKIILTSGVFFEILDPDISDELIRSLEPEMLFGFHSSLGNNPFLITKISSYEIAFAGMLEWEVNILNGVFPIFKREDSKIDIDNYKFEDIVISNKDVRAILNSEGELQFAYSFADKNTLVIANNETTFQEIFRRLRTSKLERSS